MGFCGRRRGARHMKDYHLDKITTMLIHKCLKNLMQKVVINILLSDWKVTSCDPIGACPLSIVIQYFYRWLGSWNGMYVSKICGWHLTGKLMRILEDRIRFQNNHNKLDKWPEINKIQFDTDAVVRKEN